MVKTLAHRVVAARGWGEEGVGRNCLWLAGEGFLWGEGNVLELDRRGVYTTL